MRIYTLIEITRSSIDLDMDKTIQDNKLFYLDKNHAEDIRQRMKEDYGTLMKLVSFRIADYNWSTII
jgi:hypothetical protein